MSEVQLPITPETQVAALLDAYPNLEAVLIEIAPAFKNLRNPVLRRTIAKVATLDRAAKVAGVPPRELVAKLRDAAGQPVEPGAVEPTASAPSYAPLGCHAPDQPSCDWLSESQITETIDADALLAEGVSPVGKVLSVARALPSDATLSVTVSFRPIPLIETLQQQGFRTYCRENNAGTCELFVSNDTK